MSETDAATGFARTHGGSSDPPMPDHDDPSALVLTEYNMRHERRGKCLIINNRNFDASTGQNERVGTDIDAEKMEKIFMRLSFDVERIDNMRSIDISIKMRQTSEEDHSDADCFVCIILSHGRQGYIYGTDSMVSVESLTKHFKGDVCASLAGKPKLFFLQACRGSKFDHGVDLDEDTVDASPGDPIVKRIPAEADFMIAYSVVPGYFSWRNNVDGSWFIQALCRVLDECADKIDLTHMMVLVSKIVAFDFASCTDAEWTDNMKQVPCVESMLTKLVYLRPKW